MFTAAAYGNGSYFAVNSSYSARDTYAKPNSQGHCYMMQTRVITGDWCLGKKGMVDAPYKDADGTVQFDSVVDSVASPSMFIVFKDASAYPEYVIKFQ